MFTFPVGFFTGQNDPYWDNVVLYLPMTGANGSTTFTDVSKYGHAVTRNGDAVISTAQAPPLAGVSSSGYFDGSGDKLTSASNPLFAMGTGDFTIEIFTRRFADTKPYSRIFHFGPFWNNNDSWGSTFDDGDFPNKITFSSFKLGGRLCVSTTTVVSDQWYYVAIVRSAGVFYLYINGLLESTNNTKIGQTLEASASNTFCLSSAIDRSVEEDFNGYSSCFRMTKGIARPIVGVPTTPFPIG